MQCTWHRRRCLHASAARSWASWWCRRCGAPRPAGHVSPMPRDFPWHLPSKAFRRHASSAGRDQPPPLKGSAPTASQPCISGPRSLHCPCFSDHPRSNRPWSGLPAPWLGDPQIQTQTHHGSVQCSKGRKCTLMQKRRSTRLLRDRWGSPYIICPRAQVRAPRPGRSPQILSIVLSSGAFFHPLNEGKESLCLASSHRNLSAP
mmetsp:Transcript_1919/g.3308  ORF Transcript_1919/g.3308 Transcript_1919/m.3308 type:complete len:203 (+) Transcript_1919:1070-1678(+)